MQTVADVSAFLDADFARLVAARGVPAAAIAVLKDGEVVDAAAGVLSTATRVEATPDSVFQIGSITKVWTTTLVMQLVDDGLLDLDAPIRDQLPAFRLHDDAAAGAITTRQLLCHQGGFEGDVFTDTGRGEDAIEKYLDAISDLPQLFPPGTLFSYNNAAFSVLGRLVEVLRDTTWEQAVVERIVTPLGLTHVAPSAYEAILFRAAVGHMGPGPDGVETPAPVWALAKSNEPAGSMLAMRPRDLVEGAVMRSTTLGPLAELTPDPVEEYPLVPLADRLWAVRAPGTQTWITATFYALPTGEEYVHFGARATPKVSDQVAPAPLAAEEVAGVPVEVEKVAAPA